MAHIVSVTAEPFEVPLHHPFVTSQGATTIAKPIAIIMTLDDGSYEAYPKGYRDSLRLYREKLADEKAIGSGDVVKEFAAPPQPAKK